MKARRVEDTPDRHVSVATLVLTCLALVTLVTAGWAQPAPVRIMPLGDSITDGAVGSSDDTGYRRSLYLQLTNAGYWVDFVGSQIGGIPLDFDRDHEGHGGWHANQIRDYVYGWLVQNPADIVLLHIGTNDISHGDANPQEVAQILDEIDRYESTYGVSIKVILAAIISRDGGYDPETADFNAGVLAIAQDRIAAGDDIAIVDMFEALTYPADLADAVHPNDVGYGKMGNVWFTALDSVLGTSSWAPNDVGVTDLAVTATSAFELDDDDLIFTYTLDGEAVVGATSWFRNGSPLAAMIFPFEGGDTNALHDVSGNGRTLTPVRSPVWSGTIGHDGTGAFQFNNDAYLSAGEYFPVNASYSATMWINRQASDWNNIFCGDVSAGGHVIRCPASLGNVLIAGHNSNWTVVQDATALSEDTWYFVALTYDYSTGEMILYRDGSEVDRGTAPACTDATIQIGAYQGGSEFEGVIDDVRLYNFVLSPDQISTLFSDGENRIDAAETSITDQWFARVTAFSDTSQGAPAFSNTVTIKSVYLSDVLISATSPENGDDDDLFATYTLQGGATTASVAWLKDDLPTMSLYLPFEGGSANALNDYSGKSVTVSAVGDPAWTATGGHDGFGAMDFDGNDHLIAGENFPVNSSYTKTAWVYRTGTLNNNIISGDLGAGGHAFWAPTSTSHALSAGHNSHWTTVQDSEPLALDTWYFVAVSYDIATRMMVLYKNGAVVDTATVPVADSVVTDNTITVGAFGPGHWWTGTIDDPRVYNFALSPEQIATLYTPGGTDTLRYTETEIGDDWAAWVTPFSSTEAGASVKSNTITIYGPTEPAVTDVTVAASTPNNFTDDDLTCTYTLGGDAITAATSWSRNGSPIMRAYFPFEGGQTASLADYSGNGLSLTVSGDATWNATGGVDGFGCYDFDGNDWLSAGPNFPTNSSYTKFAWVYRTAAGVGNYGNIISGGATTGSHAFWAPSNNGYHLSGGHNSTWTTVYDPDSLDLNTWTCVAMTFDYATNLMILYRDGIEVSRGNPTTPDVTNTQLNIGIYGAIFPWHGSMDEVRVYTTALTPEQVLSLYQQGRDVIKHTETEIDDEWQATVTPFSATAVGTAVTSNVLTINPYLPEVSDVVLSASTPGSYDDDDLTVAYTLSDGADGAATAWYVNSTPMLSLYLPFEGGASNALADLSGNALTVTALGTTPAWNGTAGHDSSGALVFDGTGYLSAGQTFPTLSSYTKTAWVYRTDAGGAQCGNIISGDYPTAGSHAFWAPSGVSHTLRAGHNGAWIATATVADNVPLALETWYFVAVTFDYTSGLMSLYKDGVLIDTGTVAVKDVIDSTLQVGAYGNVAPWFGRIDDARVYDFALSDDQIQAMYSTGQDVIMASETEIGDQWYADVTPVAATGLGTTVSSNTLTINEIPSVEIANLVLSSSSGNDFTEDDLTVTYDLVDAATSAATAWYLDGTPLMTVFYPFESGTSALNDYSGNAHNATPVGDPAFNATTGHDGNGAVEFDGDDYLVAGEVFPVVSSYTKSAWVYRTGAGQNIMSGNVGPNGHAFWAPTAYSHRLSAGNNGDWQVVQDTDPLALDTWYFVAVTYDQSTRLMTLYKDGVVIDTGTAASADVTDSTLQVGAYNGQYQWIGTIDDARIYNRALTADQIAAMFAAGGENVIMASETEHFDVWSAHVTPFSASEAGDTYISNNLTILEQIELADLTVAASSPYAYVSDSLFCSYTLVADAVTAATAWYLNGSPTVTALYPFEGSTTSTADLSGNDNDLTVVGTLPWSQNAGHDGFGAYQFGGSGWLSNPTAFPTQSSYTKMAWVYRTDNGGANAGNIISGTNPNPGSHAFWAPSNQSFRLCAGHNGAWTTVMDPNPLELATWYHVALTFDYTTGMLRLYKNGVEVDTATATVFDVTDPVLLVGVYGTVFPWFGVIDDARVYDFVVTPDQISAIYGSGPDLIVPSETEVGDVWEAHVTPFSAAGMGEASVSNTVTINPLPVVELTDIQLIATSPEALITDDLICSFTLVADATTSATAFYKNGLPTMAFYLPMEGGPDNALTDYSGSGATVTTVGAPAWSSSAGHDGFGAFQFDGTSWLSGGLSFPTGSSYTKTAWVYRTDAGSANNGNIISGNLPNAGSHAFWAPGVNSYRLAGGHNGAWFTVQDTEPLALNTWYFVALTFDYATGDMVLYKNGVQVSRAVSSVVDVTDALLQIGAYGGTFAWVGTIDDPCVYNYSLTPEQIASLYSAGRNTIKYTETRAYDTWEAYVTPFNDVAAGTTCVSNAVVVQPLPEALLSLGPDGQLNRCDGIDTVWLQMDYDTVVVRSGLFTIGVQAGYLQPVAAVPGPALDSIGAGNYSLTSTAYADSIVVQFDINSGQLGLTPVTIFGIVVNCVGEAASTEIEIVHSALMNTIMDPVPHRIAGCCMRIDCTRPTLAVFSPPSGQTYTDLLPTITFHLIDDIDLGYGFYRLDGCTGPWQPMWVFNLVGDNVAIGWPTPTVEPGAHDLYFKITDEAGNACADSCSYVWQFTWAPPSCCTDPTGNVNDDPQDQIDLSDLVFLVNHLFLGGPAPACRGESNINGDPACEVDLTDLIYFVNHLFLGGPAPRPCVQACDLLK
ncbi:MAG: LamG-like jellyroll fold domain-containing protein [candidate division Zixibacteria bacterium]|nr:LamG-like jellyroll fold domain-containing protein [candidate division Zixibacteria bacterium]